MATLTIRLPDNKHNRLKGMAEQRKISMNKLFDELSTQALVEYDSEVHFRALAASGNAQRGLEILDTLDAHFSRS
jgi:predicted transcriptional regulator